jgi:hypothetical protein
MPKPGDISISIVDYDTLDVFEQHRWYKVLIEVVSVETPKEFDEELS